MPMRATMSEEEAITAIVYGDTFALYDEKSFNEFIEPFPVRFKANGISTDIFKGAKCLDAGCGGGRGSIFMAQSGAREVQGLDLSPKNVESSRKRAAEKGFENLSFQQSSLMEIPFEDGTFDVVWCNGVLHHTRNPDQGLKEITRVLKTGGHLWLYLYGSGGIYWYVIDWIRSSLAGTDVKKCIYLLRLLDAPVQRIGEWIDDWYVPYLRRYTRQDVTDRLDELGFEGTAALTGGTRYDTSQRRVGAAKTELALMGEGDVRCCCRKVGMVQGERHPLPDPADGKGSPYLDANDVTQFGKPLAEIAALLRQRETAANCCLFAERVIVSRAVHTAVRDEHESGRSFDVEGFRHRLCRITALLEALSD